MSAPVQTPRRTQRGQPVPGDLRVSWRLPVLLLIVEKCRGGKAGWAQMHALSWMLLTRRTGADASRILAGDIGLGEEIIGIDPAVNLAIDRAIGEGQLQPNGSRVELTDAGKAALEQIKQSGAFAAERETLEGLKGKVSDKDAKRAFGVHA